MESKNRQDDDKSIKFIIWGILLALVGAVVSGYATWHHVELITKGATDAACNINSTISCDAVAKSAYSEVANTPLGVWGLSYFVGLALLLILSLVKAELSDDNLRTYRFLVFSGVLVSIGLFIISTTAIGALCPSCIGVYLVCLGQLGLVLWGRDVLPKGFPLSSLTNGATYPVLAAVAFVLLYSFNRPTPADFQEDLPLAELQEQIKSITAQEIRIDRSAFSGLGEDFRKGPDDAKVVIVEFADFQCPACMQASSVLAQIARENSADVQVVFKNYPLDTSCNSSMTSNIHPEACKAAVLARCAGKFGKFWPYHDRVFAEQRQMSQPGKLVQWAQEIGIPQEEIDNCLQSQDILNKIKEDVALGGKLGVNSTPTIFINGRRLPRWSHSAIQNAIRAITSDL